MYTADYTVSDMTGKAEAEHLIDMAEAGDWDHQLVADMAEFCSNTENTDARQAVISEMYMILAEEPKYFVSDYENLFDKLLDSDTKNDMWQTYSFLAENPPEELRYYINELLTLLSRGDTKIQGSTCRLLSRLAEKFPDSVAEASIGLQTLLEHKNPIVRGDACLALGHIGAVEAKEDIKKLRYDPEQRNQEVAGWALSRLDDTEIQYQWSREDLLSYDPTEFEELVADLYTALGSTEVTPPTQDGGYDVEAVKEGTTLFLEAKRWDDTPVGIKTARELVGVGAHGNADRVTIVTSSSVTQSVHKFRSQHPSLVKPHTSVV